MTRDRIEEYDDGYDSKESFERAGADQPEDVEEENVSIVLHDAELEEPDDTETHEYAFDVVLRAAIRVNAPDEDAARDLLREHLNAADCNGGAWPNGDPITFEASVDNEVEFNLYEIDGEAQ